MTWHSHKRTYIIGAGIAGIAIAKEIKSKGIFGRVIAFLDDDPEKIGKRIDGTPILGPIEDIARLLNTTPEDIAIIAIPSGTKEQFLKIYKYLKQAKFSRIQIVPRISQILEGDAHLIQARDINPEDLLARNPVKVCLKKSLAYVRGKRVLITGAGGSIGSELARQLLSGGAERLYLFGHGENSIYEIMRECKLLQEEGVGEKATIVPVIGELQDRDYMFFILKRLKADIVFHTAAHKHVPMLEANPVEAIKNNVYGTKNIVDACINAGTSRFVLISTDKAIEPQGMYGASKLIAEEIVLQARKNGFSYMVVRLGNVLGSRGSFLPLFKEQIRKGGPVTVTHSNATRFFMTIPEASSLVLKASGLDIDGDLFMLDMGKQINIKEIAEKIILFYGYYPGKEIKIEYIGLRPGEKLHEKICSNHEIQAKTEFPKINKIIRNNRHAYDLDQILDKIKPICFADPAQPALFRNRKMLKSIVKQIIPTLAVPEDEPEY
ncbi:MAG: polysaccharide biosynthesis protein [Spirochaetales bacterium]|nr:polysaccharide biosynthesis protein [Spirochaetales bacterium]